MSSVAALPLALAGYAVNAASNVAWFFPMLVAAIAYFHYELLDPESRPIDVATELLQPEYDFIIVGAGSAGMYSTRHRGILATSSFLLLSLQSLLSIIMICSLDFFYRSSHHHLHHHSFRYYIST
jgi:hypothetical protein